MTEKKSQMAYVRLGNSGLKVSRIILIAYGDPQYQSWILDEKTSIAHIKHAYARGINAFDTANVYSDGASEVVLGKALKALDVPRHAYVVLTKVFFPLGGPKLGTGETAPDGPATVNSRGLSRKHIFDSIRASLERLQLDYVDVLQCHRFDPDTPIAETMHALHDVVQAGLARYVGMSSCWAWQFHQMQNYAIQHNLTPFISMQNFHNAAYREEEREMMPTLRLFNVGMIPWSPLMRGFLTRPWDAPETERVRSDTAYKLRNTHKPDDARKAINEAVAEIAKNRGLSMGQVALAWSLGAPGVTAPIVGSTNLERLDELIDAVNVTLTDEERKLIDTPYLPQAITGHT